MIKILMFVPWPTYHFKKINPNVRIPDQVVDGEKYWFFKYWPKDVEVNVVGVQKTCLLYPLEQQLRFYLQHIKYFNEINKYELLLTHDSQTAFVLALIRSKVGLYRTIPHVMIDVGLPGAPERLFHNVPLNLKYDLLKQVFNTKSVSHIIFHSLCQRPFYEKALGFPKDMLSYVPFGIETDYFKPEHIGNGDYIFAAGEFRDFDTLLRVYEKWHDELPELRIRSALPKPKHIPAKVRWLPRAPISTFKNDILKAKFVIVPLYYTFRSTGLMTLLQSMALGKAVLVSKVPPVYSYVKDSTLLQTLRSRRLV
jgi:glycosyltransferase involved in cell wall biosynthesis